MGIAATASPSITLMNLTCNSSRVRQADPYRGSSRPRQPASTRRTLCCGAKQRGANFSAKFKELLTEAVQRDPQYAKLNGESAIDKLLTLLRTIATLPFNRWNFDLPNDRSVYHTTKRATPAFQVEVTSGKRLKTVSDLIPIAGSALHSPSVKDSEK